MKRQSGLSLVELMIALTLGLIIAGATIQMFVGTRQTQGLNDEINRQQENARFALQILTESVRLAGYQGPTQFGAIPEHFLQAACGSYDPCTDDGGASASDRIAVQLNPPPDDGTERDCTGAGVAANAVIANVFYISTTDGVSSLTCRTYNVTTGAWAGNAQALISGIDSMQVQYGLNPAGEGVTSFVSADKVADWATVAAVRIGLLVSSGANSGQGDKKTREYVVLDADKLTYDDKFLRQIFTATIAVQNQ